MALRPGPIPVCSSSSRIFAQPSRPYRAVDAKPAEGDCGCCAERLACMQVEDGFGCRDTLLNPFSVTLTLYSPPYRPAAKRLSSALPDPSSASRPSPLRGSPSGNRDRRSNNRLINGGVSSPSSALQARRREFVGRLTAAGARAPSRTSPRGRATARTGRGRRASRGRSPPLAPGSGSSQRARADCRGARRSGFSACPGE